MGSSTFRVETPWTDASCTTAPTARSPRRCGSSSAGKQLPGCPSGIASASVPTRVSQVRVLEPLRYAGPLVPLAANAARHLRLHQRLGEHPHALAPPVAVLLRQELADGRRWVQAAVMLVTHPRAC